MRAGVGYLQETTPCGISAVWLNIGICGHGSLGLGDGLIVDKVITQSGRIWQLNQHIDIPQFHRGPLTCVSEPQAVYEPEMAYDMESAGFLDTLAPMTPIVDLCILKIISDNPENGIETINGKWVRDLVTNQMERISYLIQRLSQHE
jgi:hypothetical protein